MNITNQHGSVDLGLPEHGGFVLDAQTRNGELENDFGLVPEHEGDVHRLNGTVSGGGPQICVEMTDGDVTVRKAVAAPVPPTPPPSPKLSSEPPAAPPAAPGVAVPKPPAPPKPRHSKGTAKTE